MTSTTRRLKCFRFTSVCRGTFFSCVLLILSFSCSTAADINAAKPPKDTKLIPIILDFTQQWKALGFKDNKRTQFSVSAGTLRLTSDRAVAFYYHKLPRLSQISHCDWLLSFEWRVLEAENMSLQRPATGDDRPLAVHIWVNDASQYGWFKGSLAKLFSVPTPGYMLTYSWGLPSEWQHSFENPHLPERAFIKVLKSRDQLGEHWHVEAINISADLKRHFGDGLLSKKLYVVVSADTEDNMGSSVAEIRNIMLVPTTCESLRD